jgi:hypothetical protein
MKARLSSLSIHGLLVAGQSKIFAYFSASGEFLEPEVSCHLASVLIILNLDVFYFHILE